MPLKRMLLASSAAIALIAPETVSAQGFGFFDQRFDRQRYNRPTASIQYTRPAKPAVATGHSKPSERKPATTAAPFPASTPQAAPATAPEPVIAAPIEPPAPLTEEQMAAKTAVDELLQREPALWAAKDRPDPALAKAAAEKHRQQDLLKAKEEAAAARRRALAERNGGRDEARVAALSVKPDAQARTAKPRTDAGKGKPNRARSATDPARRMPATEFRTSAARR